MEGRDEGREEWNGNWGGIKEGVKVVKKLLTNYIKPANILGLGYLKLGRCNENKHIKTY